MGDILYVCPALTACLVGAFDKSAVSRVRLSDIVGLAGCLSDRAGGMPLVLSVSLSLAGTAWLAMLHSCVFLFIAPVCHACIARRCIHSLLIVVSMISFRVRHTGSTSRFHLMVGNGRESRRFV
jgi:hypothetical protein